MKKRISHWKGKTFPPEMKEKLRLAALRKWKNPAYRDHMSRVHSHPRPDLRGANHWNWKNNATPLNKQLRRNEQYKEWRQAVFKRDDYTCVFCGIRGTELHPDHIMPWSLFPNVRYDVLNGRTLCKDCHRDTSTYGFKLNKVLTDLQRNN